MSSKWLALWVVGLLVSLVPTALMFFLLEGSLGLSLAMPVQVFLTGFMVAGVAAAISGKTLLNGLRESHVAGDAQSIV
jgi:hypothetical protein